MGRIVPYIMKNIEKKCLKPPTRLLGGWPTPLKNMSSSVGMIIPKYSQYMESHKKHVPVATNQIRIHRICQIYPQFGANPPKVREIGLVVLQIRRAWPSQKDGFRLEDSCCKSILKATDTSKETSSKKNPRTPININRPCQNLPVWLCMALFSMSFHMFPLWNVLSSGPGIVTPKEQPSAALQGLPLRVLGHLQWHPLWNATRLRCFFHGFSMGFPWFSMVLPWFSMVFHGFLDVFFEDLSNLRRVSIRWFFRWFFWGPKRIPNRISSKRMICAHV